MEFLSKIFQESIELVGSDDSIKPDIDEKIQVHLLEILRRSESAKGVITVVLTSAVYKKLHPE